MGAYIENRTQSKIIKNLKRSQMTIIRDLSFMLGKGWVDVKDIGSCKIYEITDDGVLELERIQQKVQKDER